MKATRTHFGKGRQLGFESLEDRVLKTANPFSMSVQGAVAVVQEQAALHVTTAQFNGLLQLDEAVKVDHLNAATVGKELKLSTNEQKELAAIDKYLTYHQPTTGFTMSAAGVNASLQADLNFDVSNAAELSSSLSFGDGYLADPDSGWYLD